MVTIAENMSTIWTLTTVDVSDWHVADTVAATISVHSPELKIKKNQKWTILNIESKRIY